jgi:hypothetical protein
MPDTTTSLGWFDSTNYYSVVRSLASTFSRSAFRFAVGAGVAAAGPTAWLAQERTAVTR